MINIPILLSALLVLIYYFFCVLNSKTLWLRELARQSALIEAANKTRSNQFNLGHHLYKLLPSSFTDRLYHNYILLNRSPEMLYKDLSAYFISVLALSSISFCVNNILFPMVLILFILCASLESFFAVRQMRASLDKDVEHLVKCLEVLLIKSEVPLLTALQLINKELSSSMKLTQRELQRIITQAQKDGLKETLMTWQTESFRFRTLIAILLAASDGASKIALRANIASFLHQIQEQNTEDLKNEAENLQLYLIAPALVMLLIVTYPMMDAVMFFMNNIRGS